MQNPMNSGCCLVTLKGSHSGSVMDSHSLKTKEKHSPNSMDLKMLMANGWRLDSHSYPGLRLARVHSESLHLVG